MAGYFVMILEWFWIDAKLKCIKNALAGWARDQAARHFGGGEKAHSVRASRNIPGSMDCVRVNPWEYCGSAGV